jgi:hypothetical protein
MTGHLPLINSIHLSISVLKTLLIFFAYVPTYLLINQTVTVRDYIRDPKLLGHSATYSDDYAYGILTWLQILPIIILGFTLC